MWFKNLQLHYLPASWAVTPNQLERWLTPHAFQLGNSVERQTFGRVSSRDDGALVYSDNGQMLLVFRAEKKLLPASVINQVTKARALELKEQQGSKPGRKQLRELEEQVTDELLPHASSVRRDTWVQIDTANGWFVIDTASQTVADDVRGLFVKSVGQLPLTSVHVKHSPITAMTEQLLSGEAPGGFTVDQDAELRSTGEDGATMRYVGHVLEAEDMRRYIEAGRQYMRPAMAWDDRVSFALTLSLLIKRVTPLNVIKEVEDPTVQNDDERFDSDVVLMTGELMRILSDLVDSLGGDQLDAIQQAKAA